MKQLQGRAALQAVGELVAAEGESYAIAILGGAALSLLGSSSRPPMIVPAGGMPRISSPSIRPTQSSTRLLTG